MYIGHIINQSAPRVVNHFLSYLFEMPPDCISGVPCNQKFENATNNSIRGTAVNQWFKSMHFYSANEIRVQLSHM